jgi:LPS export ABC transporter permease LptG
VLIVWIPNANQAYREIVYDVMAARAEGEVRPRVFFDSFPNFVLYVREVPVTGGWRDVFMADTRDAQAPAIYAAERGRVILNRAARTVELELFNGERHTADPAGKYEVARFERTLLSLNPESVFPAAGPPRGDAELSIAELRARAVVVAARGDSTHTQWWYIHLKFSIPFACLVFGVIGLGLGATSRRDGKLASFVVGIGVIFAYYVLLWLDQALVRGYILPPWLGVWMPNILLGAFGVWLFLRRARAVDRPLDITLPAFLRRRPREDAPAVRFLAFGLRLVPGPSILDRYVAASYARVAGLAALAMAGIFYIATFLDMADELFKGIASWQMLGTYFWHATPQYIYYVLPLAVLLGTLVTIGLLTKNSELVVMKACGISLYRAALPMFAGALVAGGILFLLGETILGPSNRQAEAVRHVIRGGSPQTFDVLNRQWVAGSNGRIYHYNFFDPRTRRLNGLSIYEFGPRANALSRRTYVEDAAYLGEGSSGDEGASAWRIQKGWIREFTGTDEPPAFTPVERQDVDIEPVAHFGTQQPDERFMGYAQLRVYVEQLRASGFDVSQQQVALERKLSFPFVTVVMTLLAVPFAVTTGRRGAMYGIGVGIVLALAYWTAISIFAALGSGGLVQPTLAAWAPNLLFGAGAVYLILTVRT